MTLADAERDVRDRLFAGCGGTTRRIGAEAELMVLRSDDLRPAPVATTLAWLRSFAAGVGWMESVSAYGIPAFEIPAAGVLSFEPGGQLELSTHAFDSPSALLGAVRDTVRALQSRAGDAGLSLLECGIDPYNDADAAPLQFETRRYLRMAAHFARIGPAGARMMRQTASFQISVDVAPAEVDECWRALAALAPVLVATFANSPVHAGESTGDASTRARVWQSTDPSRTGVVRGGADDYARFALDAPAFLLGDRPLRALLGGGVTRGQWVEHLSTLFPEVRPRGHMEVRGCDMVGDDARSALAVLVHSVASDAVARREILALCEALGPDAFERAPRADADLIACGAAALRAALQAAKRARSGVWSARDVSRAERFAAEFPDRGRAPAHDFDRAVPGVNYSSAPPSVLTTHSP